MSPLRRGRGSSEDAVELGAMGGAVIGGAVMGGAVMGGAVIDGKAPWKF